MDDEASKAGTRSDREALFEEIFAKTMAREAFSPVKNARLNLDVAEAMNACRDEVVTADSEEKLLAALLKLSNTRQDAHLSIGLVEGGLAPPDRRDLVAPVKFTVDFGETGGRGFFVVDAGDPKAHPQVAELRTGDKLVSVDGRPWREHFERIRPYLRHSTTAGLWWRASLALSARSFRVPPTTERETLELVLERGPGERYAVSLPYLEAEGITWTGAWKTYGQPRYAEFEKEMETGTFHLYRHRGGEKVLLVDWGRFGPTLVPDMDRLMEHAEARGLLDHGLIIDCTRSRGGAKGAYAIQRFVSRPFRTTFGNLRISDITSDFVKRRRERKEACGTVEDDGITETVDGGVAQLDWLENDVMGAVREGRAFTENVPFKLAHLPKDADGVLGPAPVHFKGPLVCLFGPHGGSHLDQFAAIMVDNDLAHAIGQSTGGFSKTWIWDEALRFRSSGKPVVEYRWCIGQTIRPNGEVLEGNPAAVHEPVPLTRGNHLTYTDDLVARAMAWLERPAGQVPLEFAGPSPFNRIP